ncbi:hypothetical protein [Bremerella alba]|uniref:SnoaL-like domain-containing protein n=1 Tax=Bremerella alba TaxID=980252 RepID=A0A7V8V980_9BACT|nr:hypothetical protein [Bremerella alba]MBA2117258.1 hypothetical protein [Bremerella alba]
MNTNRLLAFACLAVSLLLSGCQKEIEFDAITDADFVQTQTEIVQADVAALIEATKSEDIEALIEFSHPRVVNYMGGRADAYFGMEKAFQEFHELQMSYDVFDVNGQPTFYRTDRHEFVIQKMHSVCLTPEMSIAQNSALIGMRDLGTQQWKYMDYNSETEKKVYKIFPGLPKSIELPEPTVEVTYK